MIMAYTTHTLARGSQADGIVHTVKQWWDAFWAYRAKRTTVFMLRGLDDRTLHDIGVDRSEIESFVFAKSSERQRHYEPLPR
jgi:uncharacterized protein YjiS (DUF1127 family)